MEIVKLLKDYSNTRVKDRFGEYLSNKLDSAICVEKIKNKDFMIKYIQPIHNLIIYTTQLPCSSIQKVSL